MFDKLKLIASTYNQDLDLIIETNGLTEVKRGTKTSYDNIETKNFTGLFIRIETDKSKITIDGSLHKYFNYLQNNVQENHSQNVCITDVLQTFDNIANNTKISLKDAKVKRLEIGLNLYVSSPPAEYINSIKSISPRGTKQPFKIVENPKYKNKSEIVTNMHRTNRKYYKVYDKIHELKDKKKSYPENKHILRIETVWQRVDKVKVSDLLFEPYFKGLLNEFVDTWQSVEFERITIYPKGTSNMQRQLINEIQSNKNILEKWRTMKANNELTQKQFRTRREFLQKKFKTLINKTIYKQTKIETEFRQLMELELQKMLNNRISDK